MARFLVEAYFSGDTPGVLTEALRRASVAGGIDGDLPVSHLRSILVPGDETCFHLFESPSIEALEDVCRRAQLPFDRIVEAVEPIPCEGGIE
jgi:hypothetical protein